VSAIAIDSSYVAFFTFTFVLVVTPGSTTAVVVRNTLEGGRRAGYQTALGAALANITIAIACGLGLSVLIGPANPALVGVDRARWSEQAPGAVWVAVTGASAAPQEVVFEEDAAFGGAAEPV